MTFLSATGYEEAAEEEPFESKERVSQGEGKFYRGKERVSQEKLSFIK